MLTATTLGSLRDDRVLVSYDQDRSTLTTLLPCPDPARASASRALDQLGFRPETSAISWTKNVRPEQLGQVCSELVGALGAVALWDVGPVFAQLGGPIPARVQQLSAHWSGDFVLHVRGTRRCLIFDRDAPPTQMQMQYDAEWRDHQVHDFAGTE